MYVSNSISIMMKTNCSLLVVLIILLPNCSIQFSAATRTLSDDKSSLLALKSHITASQPNNILAKNWTEATPVCKWMGISCGVRHRRVTALNLSYMGLRSTIPPQLGNLSFLASLNISHNSFHGVLPQELAQLRRLKAISLAKNNFIGELPIWLGNFRNLEHLILANNGFTGSIPSVVFNISSLRRINLIANNLSGSLPVDICSNLPKLEVLSLGINQLNGQIPSNLHKCTQLQSLILSQNGFSGSIPSEIGNLTMLNELVLAKNNLKGPIPSSLFNMSSLGILVLEFNSLSGNLPVDTTHCNVPSLEALYLDHNQLTGEIPLALWHCQGLRDVQLANNKFTGSIPKNVGNLSLLQFLYLDDNHLTGTLPGEINNGNLEEFGIIDNELTGLIPLEIFNSSTLRILDLQANNFSGPLPSSMGLYLPNLEELYLNVNRLNGTLPSSITNASKLTFLEMAYNSLTGLIPNTLGNLSLLKSLVLTANKFTTAEPTTELRFLSSLTNCRQLNLLDFSINNFTGSLPASIGNFSTSLQYFAASFCKIKGQIPPGIGNLSKLQFLELDTNEFTGFIPTTIGRLTHLEFLQFGANSLEGPIPDNFCLLKSIGTLILANNSLSGSIPACFGELKASRVIHLDSNKLTGAIPPALWSLADVWSLGLSSNFLSGNISPDIRHMKVLSELDLSHNQFSGYIPNTIEEAQELRLLMLEYNKLQGPIPYTFGNLKGLEYLDLSNNNLSEEIPKSLETLKNLEYLNLSCNNLKGEIPDGGHFLNFTAQSFTQNEGLCGDPRFQVPTCKSLPQSRSTKVIVLKSILPAVASAIFVAAVLYLLINISNQNSNLPTSTDPSPIPTRRISYYELVQATESFSDQNLLGAGSFGTVYKGTLSDGLNVAIKVFNLQHEGAMRSFDVECEVLRQIHHRNLVSVISTCMNMDFRALVLEYMPNGSLDKWLHSKNHILDILQRLNIMIDVASAMVYLHLGFGTPILHCDLKPSNILLDSDMVAHLCDFGIAKLLGEEKFMEQTNTLATVGYMAPEYGQEGIVSTSGDVYSFGVTLMETFTRKKPTNEMFSDELSLRSWVNFELLHGSVAKIVDTDLLASDDVHFAAKEQFLSLILTMAMDCTKQPAANRVTMEDVKVRLDKIKTMFMLSMTGRMTM